MVRSTGILRSWNDERGFGFIAPTQGGAELFVHISAFAHDGSRPVAGETLLFERGAGKDGKPQAIHVVRQAVGTDLRPSRGRRAAAPGKPWLVWIVALCLVAGAAGVGYRKYQAYAQRRHLEAQPAVSTPAPEPAPAPGVAPRAAFRCDGRTHCSQMTSCAEATWFVNHCAGTQMDGNHDGVPCEQQWCTGPGAR
jgi:cold shock CspA family protein